MKSWKGMKRYFIVVSFLGSIAILYVLFNPPSSPDFADDLTYADPTVVSARVQEIADTLASGEPYVDPLLEATVGRDVLTEEVLVAATSPRTEVHLVAATTSRADSTAHGSVLLARIAHATARDGLYVLFDQDGRVEYTFRKQGRPTHLHLRGMFGEASEVDLLGTFDSLDATAEEASPPRETSALRTKMWTGALFGAVLSVPIWFLLKLIRWAARRNRSYLEGFS